VVTVEAPGLGSPDGRGGRVNHVASPVVVKLGGRALEAPGAERELATAVSRLGAPVVIAHGGGAEVTAWCDRLGLATSFHDGLRVTDFATLEVAAAVLAGLANKRLVAALRAAGVDAVGLSALDGGLVVTAPHPAAETLGRVGIVRTVDASVLRRLLASGSVPVVASIADDGAGGLLNVNADDLAAALATALGSRALVLFSDAPGVMLGGRVAPSLDVDGLDAALESVEVRDGMRPKLRAARAALRGGVARIHVAAWSGAGTLATALGGHGGGTTIEVAAPAGSPT
jgi:acetylglutamate kinase